MNRGVQSFLSHRSRAPYNRWLIAAARALLLGLIAGLPVASAVAGGARDIALGHATAVGDRAPANIPSDYVITPDGYFHHSCVHVVAADDTIDADGNIVSMSGQVHRTVPCAYPHYAADGTRLEGNALQRPFASAAGTAAVYNGWVVDGEYLLPRATPVRFLSAQMMVPPAPSIRSGQTIYFFPGLEDYESTITIIQPVLGWNAFNDNAWTIASWNCCQNGTIFHSAPVAVSSGDTIQGRIAGLRCSSSTCPIWSILSSDVTSGKSTTLNTSGLGQVFDWVFGGTLEVYGVSQCGQYPDSTTQDFTRISVYGSSLVKQSWQPRIATGAPACGYSAAGYPNSDSRNLRLTY